ncbi:hypothetical protein JTB14_006150 [Gonioctena quinquepunctata]|nr:hypothetical protein JTB14_006150 [Gonioctena quinquepunctata]
MHRSLNNSRSRRTLDRFIPRRQSTDFDISYHIINHIDEGSSPNPAITDSDDGVFINTAKHTYHLNNYREALKTSLLRKQKKVLQFSSPIEKMNDDNEEAEIWPVEPRSRPLLGAPSIVLDMPELDTHLCHQVVDWGKKGYIAATYDGEVHLWHPEKVPRRVTHTKSRVRNCIKWNKEGTHFAIALNNKGIAIWDSETFKTTAKNVCQCLQFCQITSIEWTKSNHLISGCTEGRLCYWSPSLTCIKTCPYAHLGDVIAIKLSCREKSLATTGIDRQIKTWFWPEFTANADMKYNGPTKAIDWHPWKDSLLAVGGPIYSTIWNVCNRKIVSFKEHPHPESSVDCLSFNPLSGELLVSYYSVGDEGNTSTYITVLKNLTCIVDEVKYNNGRVPYLLWDSTGTKLGTASSDENLCIWDFFGTSSKMRTKYLRKTKRTLSTNMFANLNQFGHGIR